MSPDILQHTECPRCGAPNLTTEAACFACGRLLRPLRKRLRGQPAPEAPWLLWLALLVALLAAGFAGWHLAAWIAGFRARSNLAPWHLPAAGIALLAAGQAAFHQARLRDRRWWRLKRAPEMNLSRSHVGDAVWLRGRLECDTPVVAPYIGRECAYYRYRVREREHGQAGWRETKRGSKAVDFRLVQEQESVYVPSGAVLFDAPLYADAFADASATLQVRVWALPIGVPTSVCGVLAGESSRKRMDPLDEFAPIIATWRQPADYVQFVEKRARAAQTWGWALTVLGVVVFIAGIVSM